MNTQSAKKLSKPQSCWIRTLPASAPRRETLAALLLASLSTSCPAAEKITFEQHVRPIFRQHCQACHSQDDASAGLALDDYNAALAGGAGGEVLASADTDGSRLWKLVNHEEQPVMPPGGEKLPKDQLAILKQWIEGGLLKDSGSKPRPSAKPAIAELATDNSGRPTGPPAMPERLFRQPVLTAATPGPVVSLAASRWAPLAAVPWQRQVSFYHTQTHQLLGIVPYVDGSPTVVRFSRDGGLLLVAGGRNGVQGNAALFDVQSGARLATLGDELDTVLAADISADNALVAIGGPKKKVRVYRVADGVKVYELSKHTDWITALAFSPNEKLIATGDRSAGLRVWDAAAGHERSDLRGHKGPITDLAWRADSAVLASTSEDGTLRLWNPEGKPIKSTNAHGPGALSVSFAPDGRIVTAGRDNRVRLWKPDGAGLGELARLDEMALSAVFVEQGAKVLASDYLGCVRLIEVASRKVLASFEPNPPTLEARLASAESELNSATTKIADLTAHADSAVAAWNEGKQEHEAYEKRLANAEAELTAVQKAKEDRSQEFRSAEGRLAVRTQEVATAEQAVEQVELAANAPAKLEESSGEGDGAAAKLELANSTLREAMANHAAARQQRDAAKQRLRDAAGQLDKAEKLLADVSNQQAALPDLAALRKASGRASADSDQAAALVEHATKRRDQLKDELIAFTSAAARLAEEARSATNTQTDLAQQLGAAESEQQAAAAAVEQQDQQLGEIEAQISQLRKRLQQLRKEKVDLTSNLGQSEQRLLELREQLAKTERASQVAAALLRDFTAAQALRDAYAEPVQAAEE